MLESTVASESMIARLRRFRALVADTFWVVPACVVLACGLLAIGSVQLDLTGRVPRALIDSAWLYDGGATGARTLLGAVAASAIGVAGTVFSITIAALSLAAGQMGPRLLRNFVRDRGNQLTLGTLLGTFTYALIVLRSVRGIEEGGFIPHLSMTVGIALALCCVAMLIFFVGHIAGRINVDTVITLVGADLQASLRAIEPARDETTLPVNSQDWGDGVAVPSKRAGYLQELDVHGLVRWAEEHRAQLRLLVRPGHYVFPGATVALVRPAVAGVEDALRDAFALGPERTSQADLEYAIRQLVEVAMRALSPGINDPFTAVTVIDRLGTALCELVSVRLPTGQHLSEGRLTLLVPTVDYDGLTDTMFHPLRQSAAGNALVLIRLLEVLAAVAGCEADPARRATLQRHADLVMADGERTIGAPSDLCDLRLRYQTFCEVLADGITTALRPTPLTSHRNLTPET
jgi:uncharacterized membrane protein